MHALELVQYIKALCVHLFYVNHVYFQLRFQPIDATHWLNCFAERGV